MGGSKRAEEFIEAFNQIDQALRKSTGLTGRNGHTFAQVLRTAAEQDAYVRQHRDDLREYAELRNAIVHGPQHTVIAEPFQPTVDKIKSLAANISKPLLARQVMTPQPLAVSPRDTLATAVRLMGKHDYSQLLVSFPDGMSLINSEHIRCWLGTQVLDDVISLHGTLVEEVCRGIEDDGMHCVSRQTTAFEAMQVFESSIGRGRERVYAIVVTQNASRNERPLGIITPWDLVKAGASFGL